MREIKFRAWDHYQKRMFPVDGLRKEETGDWTVWEKERRETVMPCNIYLMQYTGLKDKNGKEIYEGDIVKCGVWGIYPITVSDFHGYRFMFGKDILTKSTGMDGEVIGNVWENPELLKEKS